MLPVVHGLAKLVDDIGLIVPVLFPYVEEVKELLGMLGRVWEGRGALEQARQGRLNARGKAAVLVSNVGLVEGVAQDVEEMQTLAPGRGLPRPPRGGEVGRVGAGQGDQVPGHGGDPGGGVGQIREDPLLAFLRERRFSCRAAHGISRGCWCCSNLDMGRGASRGRRVEPAEELVDLGARARRRVCAEQDRRERHLGDGELRRRHREARGREREEWMVRTRSSSWLK